MHPRCVAAPPGPPASICARWLAWCSGTGLRCAFRRRSHYRRTGAPHCVAGVDAGHARRRSPGRGGALGRYVGIAEKLAPRYAVLQPNFPGSNLNRLFMEAGLHRGSCFALPTPPTPPTSVIIPAIDQIGGVDRADSGGEIVAGTGFERGLILRVRAGHHAVLAARSIAADRTGAIL